MQLIPTTATPEWSDILDHVQEWNFPAQSLAQTAQSSEYHAEGDVLTHTRMAVEQLFTDPAYLELSPAEQQTLLLATLLHDVAKPFTSKVEDGVIHHYGHAHKGEKAARALLWRAGLDYKTREHIAQLIRYHQIPFHLLERPDPRRDVLEVSYSASIRDLAILARADGLGRLPHPDFLDSIEYMVELAEDLGAYDKPYSFGSDAARFHYFHTGDDPSYAPFEAPMPTLTLLSGLPGSGKDSYLRLLHSTAPVVSLDAIRLELGVSPTDNQGKVISVAKEQLKTHLRRKVDVIHNATNLSRSQRSNTIELALRYGYRIHITCIETTVALQAAHNKNRAMSVPDAAVEHMLRRWEFPTLVECHELAVI